MYDTGSQFLRGCSLVISHSSAAHLYLPSLAMLHNCRCSVLLSAELAGDRDAIRQGNKLGYHALPTEVESP